MRNLQHVAERVYNTKGLQACICVEDSIYTVSLTEATATIIRTVPAIEHIATFEVPDFAPDLPDRIINAGYIQSSESLCVIMYGGDIVLLPLSTSKIPEPDIIGTIDQAVESAAWSPDGDVVAIVTKDKLSLLTSAFESLAEFNLTEDDIKLSANQMSVGWGRTETQFRGKNAPRDPTLPTKVDEGTISADDDGATRLSWRGDGQYLSLSTLSSRRRVIRVFSRTGVLESTSEPIDDHESLLAWRPSGGLIASTQKLGDTRQCIFFEKNGLRHGEFDLRKNQVVKDLQWNSDSSILAVLYSDAVELWSPSNYHYSLKSRSTISHCQSMIWHNEQATTLFVVASDSLIELRYDWTISTNACKMPYDYGLVAMIDGLSLGLTPLRLHNVPPPMAFRKIELPAVPRSVCCNPSSSKVACVFQDVVQIYSWNLSQKPIKKPELTSSYSLDMRNGESVLQAQYSDNDELYVLTSQSRLLIYRHDELSNALQAQASTSRIVYDEDDMLLQSANGCMSRVSDAGIDLVEKLPEYCPYIITFRIDGESIICGLARSGKLYQGSKIVANKITSILRIGTLIAVTTANYIKFASVSPELLFPPDDANNERCRQIDRGSKIICACPSGESIILQAPRGNLETIYPRALVLSGIRYQLTQKLWGPAWRKLKVHRVDTNLMFDHDPNVFLHNLPQIIDELKSSTELDLLLSTLKPGNVTETHYIDSSKTTTSFPNKINTICDEILKVLESRFRDSHLSSILTAHLTKIPPSYSSAIPLIASLTALEKETSIDHVSFLIDPQELYTQALGLYDLPMALLFAQKSQRDPREYIPFLQGLQQLPAPRRQVTIDDHLSRHESAMRGLLAIDWEESIGYIAKHELWKSAIVELKYDDRLSMLYGYYATYLKTKQMPLEAGHAYLRVNDYNNATQQFEEAGSWRNAIFAAKKTGMDVLELAIRLARQMEEKSLFNEAAEIYRDYANDVDAAMKNFCRGFKFSNAFMIADDCKMKDIVVPGVTECFVQVSELLSEMSKQLDSQIPRLEVVRTQRIDHSGVADEEDGVSLAGTATTSNSLFTRYTSNSGTTSRSKRRMERQRARGKQGTIWEEEYLVNSFSRLVERLDSTRSEAKDLVIALFRVGMHLQAGEIQKSIKALVVRVRENIDGVFSGIQTLPEELQRTLKRPVLGDFEDFVLC